MTNTNTPDDTIDPKRPEERSKVGKGLLLWGTTLNKFKCDIKIDPRFLHGSIATTTFHFTLPGTLKEIHLREGFCDSSSTTPFSVRHCKTPSQFALCLEK